MPEGAGTFDVSPLEPEMLYEPSEPVTVAAIPSAGFLFDHWDGEFKTATGNIALVVMDTDKTLTAFFVPSGSCCSLLVNTAVPDSGTVTLSPPQPIDGYAPGDNVTLTAEAAAGYLFSRWEGTITSSQENTALLTMDGNKTVTAVFNPTVAVVRDPSNGGTVALEPEQPWDGYASGTEVTAAVSAAEGYEFDHWSGDLSGAESQQAFTVDGPMTITAHFVAPRSFPWTWVGVGVAGFFLVILLAYFIRTEISKS